MQIHKRFCYLLSQDSEISGCRIKVPSEQEQEQDQDQVMEDHVILPSLCLHFAVPPFPLIEVVFKE